ncbi:MAG: enoyl-CoA hydratase/isomerase family protein [Acidimicrobiales bacterium]|nr:enoyl-CoA hydratase/isomerase family protein [Acidimicrobiales bacterium]
MSERASETRVLLERDDKTGIARITLDNPERKNAYDPAMRRQLGEYLDELAYDDDTKVVVLRGAGGVFSTGADMNNAYAWYGDGASKPETRRRPSQRRRLLVDRKTFDFYHAFLGYPKVTVAEVSGFALGGGFELALMADIRVASERARFGELFVKRGLCCDVAGLGRLAQLVGREAAAELLFTGRIVDATEARDMRLVSRVVAHDDLLPTALGLAGAIAANPPLAVQRLKRGLRTALDPDWHDLGRWVSASLGELFRTADHREGVAAFLDKREPRYLGR